MAYFLFCINFEDLQLKQLGWDANSGLIGRGTDGVELCLGDLLLGGRMGNKSEVLMLWLDMRIAGRMDYSKVVCGKCRQESVSADFLFEEKSFKLAAPCCQQLTRSPSFLRVDDAVWNELFKKHGKSLSKHLQSL